MKVLAEILLSLDKIIKESKTSLVLETLNKYNSIPKEYRNIHLLRRKLRKGCRKIFEKNQFGRRNELFIHDIKNTVSSTPEKRALDIKTLKRDLKRNERRIETLLEKVKILFPSNQYSYSFRIKNQHSLLLNFKRHDPLRAILDIVGIKVVPKSPVFLPRMLNSIEEKFGAKINFKLNTMAYTENKLRKKLGLFSIYYRAVHYYFKINSFYMELQVRTPAIDAWSRLHHDTIYKPKIQVSNLQKRAIMEFGRISNIVDYYELLTSKDLECNI